MFKRSKTKSLNIKYTVLLISLLLTTGWSAASWSAQSEFEAYKAEQQQGITQQKKEFVSYRQAYTADFSEYKKQILQHWKTLKVTNKTQWVDYKNSFSQRSEVDFKNNEIRLSYHQKPSQQKIKQDLKALLNTSVKQAQQQDPSLNRQPKNTDNNLVLAALVKDNKGVDGAVNTLAYAVFEPKPVPQPKAPKAVTYKIPLPKDLPVKRAALYQKQIEKAAKRWKVNSSLIYAVIHTESYFNPMARSPVPAYGLMQIVPGSAGLDASKLVYGKSSRLSAGHLYNADNNIRLGSAYLHLLYNRYLKAIKDPQSRTLCMIAAYNTGAGNVARTFNGTTNITKAAKVINQLTPVQVYQRLLTKLPYKETRDYLKKVSQRNNLYLEKT